MKHKISKFKITSGTDANQMLEKKLVRNFVEHGYMTTTITKASYLKSLIESLVARALKYSEAKKNILLPFFGTEKSVLVFVEIAKQRAKDGIPSGVVRILKLGERMGDAAPMAKITWTHEIVNLTKVTKKEVVAKKTK